MYSTYFLLYSYCLNVQLLVYQYLDKQESVANAATAINFVSLLDESLSDTSSTQLLTPCGEVFEPKQTCRMSGCVTLNIYH